MASEAAEARFQSALAPLMEQFIEEKRACGYRYCEAARTLGVFDRFLLDQALPPGALPWSITGEWLAKRPHESANTHRNRISVVREFTRFLCRQDYRADVPDQLLGAKQDAEYSPRILTRAEVGKLLRAADQLTPTSRFPLRHIIMPEVFRLLCGCGFRLGEVLHLRLADVDLQQGILTVRDGKFGKDRLVPPAPALVLRLRKYAEHFGARPPEAFFFPSPRGGALNIRTVYFLFRTLLLRCGIPHAGRGKGPRVHDLRHHADNRIMPSYRQPLFLSLLLSPSYGGNRVFRRGIIRSSLRTDNRVRKEKIHAERVFQTERFPRAFTE
jgi:integrase